ncbi:hypothetical protein PR048_011961 [Dryococelus australis]|uniref:Uncharacterized protein n=1 Tax=Dryococelus australis TaxID=614101 RepID=A0ABQ9HN45_9NEOP|nr:hypothetical protein PR048_011961 [Dryococelus australis]
MEVLLAKKKIFKVNVTHAEKAKEKITVIDVDGTAVDRKRIELMLNEVGKVQKRDQEYNVYEADLGKTQECLITMLFVKLANMEIRKNDCDEVAFNSSSRNEVRFLELQLLLFGRNFQDLLEVAIHNKQYLTGAQKLQCLKGLLQGEVAAALLKTIPSESVVMLCRLLDTVGECTTLLKVLQQPVKHWDHIFVTEKKLDSHLKIK